MRTRKLSQRMAISLTVITLSILAAPGAKAQCSAGPHKASTFAPELRSLQQPAAQDEESSSGQLGSAESLDKERNDSEISVLGLWKKVYYAGGVLNDVGFNQFNAGGTELL